MTLQSHPRHYKEHDRSQSSKAKKERQTRKPEKSEKLCHVDKSTTVSEWLLFAPAHEINVFESGLKELKKQVKDPGVLTLQNIGSRTFGDLQRQANRSGYSVSSKRSKEVAGFLIGLLAISCCSTPVYAEKFAYVDVSPLPLNVKGHCVAVTFYMQEPTADAIPASIVTAGLMCGGSRMIGGIFDQDNLHVHVHSNNDPIAKRRSLLQEPSVEEQDVYHEHTHLAGDKRTMQCLLKGVDKSEDELPENVGVLLEKVERACIQGEAIRAI